MLKKQTRHRPLNSIFEVGTITKHSPDLRALFSKARQNLDIQTVFDNCLPALFVGVFQVNQIKQGVLIITGQSAAIATRLRFEQDAVIEALQAKLGAQTIQRLEIRIRPKAKILKKVNVNNKLSKDSAQLLIEEAKQTQDVELRKAIEKLAQQAD
jgi:hypothetical protein